MVDRMNVCHTIFDDSTHFLQSLKWTHGRYCVSLDENVRAREKLKSLQRGSIGAEDTLSAFHKTLFIVDQAANLDYVTCDAVFQYLEGLEKKPRQ